MSRRRNLGKLALTLSVILLASVLLVGCEGDAFESNDYFMDYLTSIPVGEQVTTAAGYPQETVTKAAVLGEVEVLRRQAVEDAREQAREAYENGDLELAAGLLDEALITRKDDLGIHRDYVDVALASGDADTALVHWEEQDRIARHSGWDQTAKYWDDLVADAEEMRGDITVEHGAVGPGRVVVGAVRVRYADALDGKADFLEANGGDPATVADIRRSASTWRASGVGEMEPE